MIVFERHTAQVHAIKRSWFHNLSVFRPKSVFPQHSLLPEYDGLTSDEAKTTQDFNVQFEVARHPELLAFLAMNPYLYDDMYSWLAARGEADIDEALSHNKGYQEYREAVGK